jgi:peroxiredoxin Q/BCP
MRPSTSVKLLAAGVRELLRAKGERTMLAVGDPAPDFTLENDAGEKVQLSSQAGKTIILWFYPKADTPG